MRIGRPVYLLPSQNKDIAMSNLQLQFPVQEVGGPINGGPDGIENSKNEVHAPERKKVVVVGLGMVGIAFM